MEKEEKIVVILLCMAFLSLTIAYVTFYSDDIDAEQFSSSSVPGDDVILEGEILSKRFTYTGDHLLMNVDHGSGVIKVFVPSNNGAKDVDSRINENDRVVVTGKVDEYEGELEIVLQNSDDINPL